MRRILLYLLLPLLLVAQQPPPPGSGRRSGSSQQPSAPVQVKPEDLCAVDGQVFNAATGAPLGKATVTLRRADSTPNVAGASRSYSATSDSAGKFAITNIVAGKFRLSARRTGFVDADYGTRDYLDSGAVFSLDAGHQMSEVVFRMTPNGVITGRILDEDGEPMASLQVQAVRYHYSNGRRQLETYGEGGTNDIGEYRVAGLPPGRYYLSVSPRRDYRSSDRRGSTRTINQAPEDQYVQEFHPGVMDLAAAAPLDVGPGGQVRAADLSLSKQKVVAIKGRVVNSSGITGRYMTVFLTPRKTAGFSSMNRPVAVDPNGNFEITGVAAGSYTLVASMRDRDKSVTARLPVEVSRANVENLGITINPPVNVLGQVRLDGQASASVTTVQVSLRARDPGGFMSSSPPSARVKDDGSFVLPNVNPDLYSVSVSGLPDGFYPKSVMVDGQDVLASGIDMVRGAPRAMQVVLAANAGQAAGTVQNDQQQPAASATVVLVPKEPERLDQPQYYKATATDASGNFSFKNLYPGDYRVFAWQDIDSSAYMDPDYMKSVESRGAALSIHEGSQETVQLRLIQ